MANFCPCITPMWGALIFLMRPSMWKHLVGPVLIGIAVTIGVLVALQVPAVVDWEAIELEKLSEEYEPQVFGHNFTEFFNEDNRDNVKVALRFPIAPILAALAAFIAFQALFSKVFVKIAMLCLEERTAYTDFLEKHNLSHEDPQGGPWGCMCSTIVSLALLVATLSLNFFPIIGQILFALANGWLYTWLNLSDLLTIIGYRSFGSQLKHMLCHLYSYVIFGSIGFGLTLIPIVGQLCTGAFACGCALLLEGYLLEGTLGPEFEEGEPPENLEDPAGAQEQQLLPPSGPSVRQRPPDAPAAGGGPSRRIGGDEGAQRGSSSRARGGGVRGQVQELAQTAASAALQDERVQKLHGRVKDAFR